MIVATSSHRKTMGPTLVKPAEPWVLCLVHPRCSGWVHIRSTSCTGVWKSKVYLFSFKNPKTYCSSPLYQYQTVRSPCEDAIVKTLITAKSGIRAPYVLPSFQYLHDWAETGCVGKLRSRRWTLKKIIEKYYFFVEKNHFENFRKKYFWNFRKCPTLALINSNVAVN